MTTQATQIVFETINLEEQKSKVQLESKIMYNIDGKEVYPEEETGWIYQEYSGFASKKFIEDPAKRDFIKLQLDPEQKACIDLKEALLRNDESFEANRKMIFGKFDKAYRFLPSVKPPKGKDDEEFDEDEDVDADADENKKTEATETKVKHDSVKMKLKMDWFYYYKDQRLDRANTSAIKKAVSELMKNTKTANLDKDKKKAAISALPIKLTFKDEEGKKETVDVLMKDIEQRKEIDTKVFYRKPEKLEQNSKKPYECTEEELVQIYGDPMDPKDVRTPDDLDQFYRHRCYIRFLYKPMLLWASKDKLPGADKRTCGIKYIIYQIDIIQLPYEQTNSSQRTIYSKYAFGKKNMLINQSVDSVFTSVDKSSDEKLTKESKQTKQMKIESDNENSSEAESEESEAESEESESESESEEEVEVKPATKKGGKKTVVETPAKTTKSNKKTK